MKPSNIRFPWTYLLLAYALAWTCWIPLALLRRDYQSSPWLVLLLLLGVSGPGIAGVLLTYREEGRAGGRAFWQRASDFKRIRLPWIGMIVLFWPALGLAAIALYSLAGGSPPSFAMLRQMVAQPAGFLVIPILYLIQSAVEELGWRGYMLDRVQAIWKPLGAQGSRPLGAQGSKPLGASLVIGACHAFWHLPLFWVAGTNQKSFGFGLDFWFFIVTGLAMSIYFTWCYNSNRRSLLAVILLHAVANLSLDLFTEPGAERRIFFALAILGAGFVAAFWAQGNLFARPLICKG